MRERILTELERDILLKYLNRDVKLNGWSVLMSRSKKLVHDLRQEVELLEKALKKAGKLP